MAKASEDEKSMIEKLQVKTFFKKTWYKIFML